MPDPSRISAAWIARQIGCDVADLDDWIPRSVKQDAEGTYDQTAVIKAAFDSFRDRYWHVPKTELADILKVTPPRIDHMIRDGIIKAEAGGKLPRRQAMANIVDWLRAKEEGGTGAVAALKQSKLSKENELLELQLAQARRKSLPVDVVERAWAHIVLLCRGKFSRLGNKVAPRLAFCKTEQDMEREIQAEIDEALGELSRTPIYEDQSGE